MVVKYNKTGNLYQLIDDECKAKINGKWVDAVIYQGRDEETGKIKYFVREKSDFDNHFIAVGIVTADLDDSDMARKIYRQVILDKIKDATIKEIGEDIISNLNSISESIKTEITNEILENKEICPYQYSSQKVKAKDYIYKRLTDSANSCIEKIVKETAANICKNLKDRYDIAFATAIIDNLRKQNMLDEKVASLLLNNENK